MSFTHFLRGLTSSPPQEVTVTRTEGRFKLVDMEDFITAARIVVIDSPADDLITVQVMNSNPFSSLILMPGITRDGEWRANRVEVWPGKKYVFTFTQHRFSIYAQLGNREGLFYYPY